MDTIECGIVKLPWVPVSDNIPGGDILRFGRLTKVRRAPCRTK